MARWRALAVPVTIARAAAQAIELVAWALMARRLGPSEFGALSLAFLAARWCGLIADWGATQRGSRDVAAEDHDSVAALLWTRNRLTLLLSVGFVAAMFVVGAQEFWPLVAVVVAGGLMRDWMALGRGNVTASIAPSLVRSVLLVGGAVALDAPAALAVGVGVAYLVSALVSIAANPVHRTVRRGGLATFIPPWAVVIVVAAQVYTTIDIFLLDALRSRSEAGIYTALYRLPLAATTLVGLAVLGLVPSLSAHLKDHDDEDGEVRRGLVRAGLLGAALILAATPVIVAFGPLLFGPAYADGRVALSLLLLAAALVTAGAPLGAMWIAYGGERPLSYLVLAAAVVNVAGNLVLIPPFGMTGAAVSTVLAEGLVLGVTWRFAGPSASTAVQRAHL